MRITAQDVLQTVRKYGPVVPNKIKQILQQPDSTLIHVYLSQLRAAGEVYMTRVQLGTSAFYYTADQKHRLEPLMEHLNEKERRVAQRLKAEKLLRASTADPLTRVALSQITDFAVPIRVKTSSEEELFYRYYLLSAQDAQMRIRLQMQRAQPAPKDPVAQAKPAVAPVAAEKPALENKPVEKPKQVKKEKQTSLGSQSEDSDFVSRIKSILVAKGARVPELKEVRKNKEAEGMVILSTGLGDVQFFCKIKDKKTSNDGDLAEAILAAKAHMLPALYVTTGSVTKKAKENAYLQEITVVELGNSN